ncbi:hypothetical protein [Altericista sp. CCNU0014]|uniref:hypothetical protein n=1 Tax=Altericista sp. CCNU0014 TaxID=3082949 RepID=UPI00384DB8BA
MANKIKQKKDALNPVQNGTGEIEDVNISVSPDSAEGKALQRVSAMEMGETVDWILIEPDESVDIERVRERMHKRGYKVSS